MTEAASPLVDLPIVAKVSNEYSIRRLLLVAMLFGMGLYFLYDGFIGWPHANQVAREKKIERMPHDDLDLLLQKVLGFLLVPGSLMPLMLLVKVARGRYVFDGTVLQVPGHPPVPLDAIRTIDRTKWDRKGIAKLGYELPDGVSGTVTLDDFIYQRPPTDRIFDHIERTLTPPDQQTPPEPTTTVDADPVQGDGPA